MTQEEKQLLLQEICARLPYGVKVEVCVKDKNIKSVDCVKYDTVGTYIRLIDDENFSIKPYLRTMSSMTEEDLSSLKIYSELEYDQLELVDWQNNIKTIEFWLEEIPQYVVIKVFDWLNAHYFDYRGLIPMGLALPAPEDMYSTKTE